MLNQELITKSKLLFDLALEKNFKIVTAESCTAGLVAALITETSGSSQIFERGFVVYSDLAKQENLEIDKNILEEFGAVSEEVAKLLARNSIKKSTANLSVAITGIAGPGGGTKEKPVGLVYISSFNALNNKLICEKFIFSGNRDEIRSNSVKNAIEILIKQIRNTD